MNLQSLFIPPKCVYHVPHDEQAPCSSYHPASLLFTAIFPESAALSISSLSCFSTMGFFLPYTYQVQLCVGAEKEEVLRFTKVVQRGKKISRNQ